MSQTDAPNVPLHEIEKQLLEYLGTLKAVQEAEEEIEKEYSINKDDTGLWPVDDIKKNWGKIQMEMDRPDEDRRRADWSIVIILQMLLQRIQYDASKTQSELKEDLTGNFFDPPAETQDHWKHSKINISEETKPRKGTKTDSENLEKDNAEKIKKNTDTTDNKKYASEKLSSKNGDPGSQGIYIPLTELKATNLQQNIKKEEENTRLKLIDGKPKFSNQDDNDKQLLLEKMSYVLQYNNETNNAAWVFEILSKGTIKGPAVQSTYRLDYSTHKDHRAPESLEAYTGTGYERGHLAAAANHTWCQKARDDTDLLSNIVPQHEHLNQGKWKKLEELCRLYVQADYSKAYIYTGPLYHIEKDITEEEKTSRREFRSKYGKALPTDFFKVIILEKDNGEREHKCYEIPNKGKGQGRRQQKWLQKQQEKQQQKQEKQQQKQQEKQEKQQEKQQQQKQQQKQQDQQQQQEKQQQKQEKQQQKQEKQQQKQQKQQQQKQQQKQQDQQQQQEKQQQKQQQKQEKLQEKLQQKQEKLQQKLQQKQEKQQKKLQQLKKKAIKNIENELSNFSKDIHYIEEVSGLMFTEKNLEILRKREEVKTVNFREDDEDNMSNPTHGIVETVKIIPKERIKSSRV
nr:calponin homology domain-containing protein DDB_G0272472-like [Misgurnus anguillicaudatus]